VQQSRANGLLTQRQPTLFDSLNTCVKPLRPERLRLDDSCWLDIQRTFLEGADTVFGQCVESLPWKAGRRVMYDRMVDVPRLSAFVALDSPVLPPAAGAMGSRLSPYYERSLDLVGANYYRDGRDSVAWHRDRVGRHELNPLIAIVSLGGPRRFSLRPLGGGPATTFTLGSGDLMVMGGACQHRWEHTVPKVSVAPPRLSLTFRHGHQGFAI
jgi:alkylated DNA repair dioxygenase AlkB